MRTGTRVENAIGEYLGPIRSVRRMTVYVVNGSTFSRSSLRPAKAKRKPRKR